MATTAQIRAEAIAEQKEAGDELTTRAAMLFDAAEQIDYLEKGLEIHRREREAMKRYLSIPDALEALCCFESCLYSGNIEAEKMLDPPNRPTMEGWIYGLDLSPRVKRCLIDLIGGVRNRNIKRACEAEIYLEKITNGWLKK